MRLRTKWMVAGSVWGLIAAWLASVAVGGSLAGFFWLYLFGDDPWPAWFEPFLIAAGLLSALLAFLAVAAGGYLLGRKLERAETSWAHRGAYVAVAAAVLAGVALLRPVWEARNEAALSRKAEARARAYLAELEPVVEVELEVRRDELRLRAAGTDRGRGRYEARATLVSEFHGDPPLRVVTDTVSLDPAKRRIFDLAVPVASVRRVFVERHIAGDRGAWAVDLEMEGRVRLTPLPPPGAAGRLGTGVWNSLLLRFRGATSGDTGRVVLPLRS